MILLILYILLGALVVFLALETVKREKTWSVSIWVQTWLGVYYILIPVLMIFIAKLTGHYPGRWPNVIFKDLDFVSFQTYFSTLLFLLSFYFSLAFRFTRYSILPVVLKIGQLKLHVNKTLVILFLLFGMFSLFFYVNGLGGFKNAFKIAPYIASPYYKDHYSKLYSGTFTMFKRFIPFVIYSALFFPFYKKKSSIILLVIIPILAYTFFTFLERQRQMTIVLFIVPILGYMIEKRLFISRKFVFFVVLVIAIFPIITFLNKAFIFDKNSYEVVTGWFTYEKYIKEFNFPQISLWISQNASYDKFVLNDFYSGLFGNYLPTSLRTFQTVNDLNSYYFEGVRSTSFPPGIIANSFYHLGYFGVIFWGLLLGFLINVFELIWNSILNYDRRFAYAYVFTFMSFFAYIRTGVLGFSLYRPFFVVLMLLILVSFVFKTENVRSVDKS